MDPFLSKYAEKGVENLSEEERWDVIKYYFKITFDDIAYVRDNFFKKDKDQTKWVEFTKNKDINHVICLVVASYLLTESKETGSAEPKQKYCHECGAKLLK